MNLLRFSALVAISTGAASIFAACSSSDDAAPSVTCGAGTVQSGSECVVSDASVDDATPVDGGGEGGTDAAPTDGPTFAGITSVSPAGADRLLVTWNPATDATTPSEQIKYSLYIAAKSGDQNFKAATVVSAAGVTSVLVTDLAAGEYFVVVRAKNAAGKEDTNTVEKSGTTSADTKAPTFAGATSAESADGARVKLSWAAATDDLSKPEGISYLVYYATDPGKKPSAIPFAVSAPGATSIVTPPLPATKTKYYFVVRARDAAGNVEANTTEVNAESGSDTKAPVFSGCTSAIAKDAGGITVFWNPATDDVTAASALRYVVYGAKTGSKIDFTTPLATFIGGTSAVVTGLSPDTQYDLVCRARDTSENEDDNTTIVSDKTSADSSPPVFAGLATVTNVTSTTVDLGWLAASDDQTGTDEIEYDIWEGSAPSVDTSGMPKYTVKGVTTYKVTGLSPASKLYWVVRAKDNAGNRDTNVVEKFTTTLVSFALNIQTIFNANCAVTGCHIGTAPAGTMNLTDPAYSKIVNVPSSERPALMRIKPSDSANSWMYRKITGTHDFGEVMPPPISGGSLTAAEKDTLKTWIDQGALNN
jgi:hypothetical protein